MENLDTPYSYVIHGDEHAGNILIQEERIHIPNSWYLIDYVDVRKSDWAASIAKMLNWWEIYVGTETIKKEHNESNFKVRKEAIDKGKILQISYEDNLINQKITKTYRTFANMVKQAVELFASQSSDTSWQLRMNLFRFIFLFQTASKYLEMDNDLGFVFVGESLKFLEHVTPEILSKLNK